MSSSNQQISYPLITTDEVLNFPLIKCIKEAIHDKLFGSQCALNYNGKFPFSIPTNIPRDMFYDDESYDTYQCYIKLATNMMLESIE